MLPDNSGEEQCNILYTILYVQTSTLINSIISGCVPIVTAPNRASLFKIILQVRVNDWREGVLPTQYLLQKLEETTLALKEYETQVAPTGLTFV